MKFTDRLPFSAQRSIRFPDGFVFGVATADHQCEAYNDHDDIRDVWERECGLTRRGQATNFWARYLEDVDLAYGLGCRAFRLSLSWARLEPEPNVWEQTAFDHYAEVLTYIRSRGMKTIVTLHHNTWPLHVQAEEGGDGMLASSFPARLANYAEEAARQLGTLVDYWITLNEPNQLIYGYVKLGRTFPMPPGLADPTDANQTSAVLRLIPNLFRANKAAYDAIKSVRSEALVGTNPLVLGLPLSIRMWAEHRLERATVQTIGAHVRQLNRRHPMASASGDVDISIAQLTVTQSRMRQVLFSESYLTVHLAALHRASQALPGKLTDFAGTVAVNAGSPPSEEARAIFSASPIKKCQDVAGAVRSLQTGKADVVVDYDVLLKQYASDDLIMTPLPVSEHFFGIAMAPGSQTLLGAVDGALRQFKDTAGRSEWETSASAHGLDGDIPLSMRRRAIVGDGTRSTVIAPSSQADDSLQRIRKRAELRVGIHPGVRGLCEIDGDGNYVGLEPDLAEYIGRTIFGEPGHVQFVPLSGRRRLDATRSWLGRFVEPIIRLFSTVLSMGSVEWWSLGMAGRLPDLCPDDCVGKFDYVGTDYYWGVSALRLHRLLDLWSVIQCHYANAPVWPANMHSLLMRYHRLFPDKRIIVIENGCVTSADGYSRSQYLGAHIAQVARAVNDGAPVDAYLCWSITSNREWGLPFDRNSDFGLYHIDLDHDPDLKRVSTPACDTYKGLIRRSTT